MRISRGLESFTILSDSQFDVVASTDSISSSPQATECGLSPNCGDLTLVEQLPSVSWVDRTGDRVGKERPVCSPVQPVYWQKLQREASAKANLHDAILRAYSAFANYAGVRWADANTRFGSPSDVLLSTPYPSVLQFSSNQDHKVASIKVYIRLPRPLNCIHSRGKCDLFSAITSAITYNFNFESSSSSRAPVPMSYWKFEDNNVRITASWPLFTYEFVAVQYVGGWRPATTAKIAKADVPLIVLFFRATSDPKVTFEFNIRPSSSYTFTKGGTYEGKLENSSSGLRIVFKVVTQGSASGEEEIVAMGYVDSEDVKRAEDASGSVA